MANRFHRLTERSGRELLLVPATALVQLSEDDARAWLARLCDDPANRSAVRALVRETHDEPDSYDHAIDVLARLLARGDRVAIQLEDELSTGALSMESADGAWDEIPSLSELLPTQALHFLAIEVVDARGVAFANLRASLRMPDGSTRDVVLDRRGRWASEQLEVEGTATLVLLDVGEPPGDALALDGFTGRADDVPIGRRGGLIALAIDATHRIVVDADTRTTCVRLVGMCFELNKAFLLPNALEGIRLLRHMYDRMPEAQILVVGHTDRTGKKYRNDSMSLERAQAVVAYMTDDVDAWLANYSDSADFSRRWGATEDLLMLSSLPRDDVPYYSNQQEEHAFEAAIRRFQAANGLVEDGEAGPVTRRALIEQYMALDGTTLPPGTKAIAHGCGESFPSVPTDDEVEELENRRVEVFFFREGIDPFPSSTISKADCQEYPSWLAAVDEQRTFTPSAAGRGKVIIATDLDVEYVAEEGMTFRLYSVDGAYEQSKNPVEQGLTLEREVLLEFVDVPLHAFLTLVARWSSGAEQTLFSDVPFSELQRAADDDEVVDPFTLEPVR